MHNMGCDANCMVNLSESGIVTVYSVYTCKTVQHIKINESTLPKQLKNHKYQRQEQKNIFSL